MRPHHLLLPLLLLLPLCAFLYYRTDALEARVSQLESQLAAPRAPGGSEVASRPWKPGPSAPGGAPPAAAATPDQAPTNVAGELAALRRDVDVLREELRQARDPDEIIDVVMQEEVRRREAHVDFHRERWLEMRQDMLAQLTDEAGLTEWQQGKLDEFMTAEVDRVAELARRPDAFDDPDRLANDMLQILDETNEAVRAVLNPKQRPIWQQRRELERATIFPWLPRD